MLNYNFWVITKSSWQALYFNFSNEYKSTLGLIYKSLVFTWRFKNAQDYIPSALRPLYAPCSDHKGQIGEISSVASPSSSSL